MDKDELFEKMLQFVLEREGGYSNNPADLGGETNKGKITGAIAKMVGNRFDKKLIKGIVEQI